MRDRDRDDDDIDMMVMMSKKGEYYGERDAVLVLESCFLGLFFW